MPWVLPSFPKGHLKWQTYSNSLMCLQWARASISFSPPAGLGQFPERLKWTWDSQWLNENQNVPAQDISLFACWDGRLWEMVWGFLGSLVKCWVIPGPAGSVGKEHFSLSQTELGTSFSCSNSFPGFSFQKVTRLTPRAEPSKDPGCSNFCFLGEGTVWIQISESLAWGGIPTKASPPTTAMTETAEPKQRDSLDFLQLLHFQQSSSKAYQAWISNLVVA